jgi:glycine cleavage system H protein
LVSEREFWPPSSAEERQKREAARIGSGIIVRVEVYPMYPEENLYTKDHEWIRVQGDVGVVGITDYAQHELGDVVYVDLPEVGDTFDATEPFGSIESVKAVSEVFSPVGGEVLEVNTKLEDTPELVNESPHQKAWMIKIHISNPEELKEMLSAEEYEEYLQELSGS